MALRPTQLTALGLLTAPRRATTAKTTGSSAARASTARRSATPNTGRVRSTLARRCCYCCLPLLLGGAHQGRGPAGPTTFATFATVAAAFPLPPPPPAASLAYPHAHGGATRGACSAFRRGGALSASGTSTGASSGSGDVPTDESGGTDGMAACVDASDEAVASAAASTTTSLPSCEFVWLDAANSTQDEARERLAAYQGLRPATPTTPPGVLAVAARTQSAGRGTRGRDWFGAPGNVFLTVAVRMADVPVPFTFTPLRIGVIMAEAIAARLPTGRGGGGEGSEDGSGDGRAASGPRVSVKWPNDVLIGDEKVAGVLIEGDGTHLLVGIGVNVRHAPAVPQSGAQRGRASTCLADHGGGGADEDARDLAAALAEGIASWVQNERPDSAAGILAEWTAWVDWAKPLVLRDEGVQVTPLAVESDGQLRVRGPDGKERLLIAEYLY